MSILTDRLAEIKCELKDLAEVSGLDPATLYNYREGVVELGIYKAWRISKAMVQLNRRAGLPVPEEEFEIEKLFADVLEFCYSKDEPNYLTRGWHVRKQEGESRNERERVTADPT